MKFQVFGMLSVGILCTTISMLLASTGNVVRGPPKILAPGNKTFNVKKDETPIITCKAKTEYAKESSTLIYWLANATFIEDLYPTSRVAEGPERQNHSLIERDLHFRKLEKEDIYTNFTCIVLNPFGKDEARIKLALINL
ncbi:interleukin-1 receptor type 2-like [Protopterus annectens]|uniref:interleukin-1 receptor type 2-like n=1 Tax=Protopterus annectens TaxID=7888 RepID=UPI001CF988FC|nr:interleukin-1 receptor type 2-like [Protopterus annectens]